MSPTDARSSHLIHPPDILQPQATTGQAQAISEEGEVAVLLHECATARLTMDGDGVLSAQIEGVLQREKEAAREALAAGHKQRALTALRRRKYQESLLQQTDQQLATLQDLVGPFANVTGTLRGPALTVDSATPLHPSCHAGLFYRVFPGREGCPVRAEAGKLCSERAQQRDERRER